MGKLFIGRSLSQHERALAIRESIFGTEHFDVAISLNNLAELYRIQENYTEALSYYERTLDIVKSVLGEEHLIIATILNNLAALHHDQGNYASALTYYGQALAIRKAALGEKHPDVAQSLNNLAALYKDQGNYSLALTYYEQALAIRKATLGEEHPDFAASLNNLAALYHDQGNYGDALIYYEQALAIRKAALGDQHSDVAQSLNNLATLHQEQGNYSEALIQYEQALDIYKIVFGTNHSLFANGLNNLALLNQVQGDYAEALLKYERALAIYEDVLGAEHPDVAVSLNNLAELHRVQGNYAAAQTYHERALVIRETALGIVHPDVAQSLNNLALLHQNQENYAEALPYYKRAFTISKSALGTQHPHIASNLNNLAILYQAQGNSSQALSLFQQSTRIEEFNLTNILSLASESQQRLYLNTLRGTTNALTSLSLQSATDVSATKLAITTTLQRKGRILESMTNLFQPLKQQLSPDEQQLFDDLNSTRAALASLHFSNLGGRFPEQYQVELTRLEENSKSLEINLARRSAEFRIASQAVTLEAVQALIPDNAALVELVRYDPFNFEAAQNPWTAPPHYAAYILTSTGQPQTIDLGEAAPIDALVANFRRALGSRASNTKTIARQLDELVMAPLRPLLGDNTHLLLSPDSQLNLIPFAALVTEDERYLIEDYQLTYLTSGRDLLRLQLDQPSQQGPVILADPDYASPGSSEAIQITQTLQDRRGEEERENQQRSVDITDFTFGPLPGTAEEADEIAPLLNNPTVLTQSNATENVLKQLNAPSILHIATHGFFLKDVEFVPPDNRGFRAGLNIVSNDSSSPIQPTPSNTENPLLRSGLALAGFNQRDSGTEDGVLTALEASGLNLYGTRLVVLSACDTGVGQVSTGEGVYGLRRAFVTAGAESQLMSLWQVDDYGTSQLMQLYYQNLKAGQGRSEALRSAQLTLLASGQYQHPYFWAAFIFSGDWSPLEEL